MEGLPESDHNVDMEGTQELAVLPMHQPHDSRQGKLMKNKRQRKKKKPLEFPSELLHLITKKLVDVKDLFFFGLVCKSWRMVYSDSWCNFMTSNAPLIVQKTYQAKKLISFYSIPESRTYETRLLCFSGFSFVAFSSGYIIMIGDRSYLLIDPFARKRIEIPKPDHQFKLKSFLRRDTLAFEAANSQEFIIVFWNQCYCKTIYVITEKGEIGVSMLNSQRLKFLNLRNNPFTDHERFINLLKLVSSNDQLLVIYVEPPQVICDDPTCFKIYMIDFCAMSWIELKTLGDRTLFLLMYSKCYSLSNPNKWGFRSNCLYYVKRYRSPKCKVLSMDKQVIETILIPANPSTSQAHLENVDWCFRPRRDVVDYSNLIE
ncbi:hypothetical protein K1719_023880 [Acacia pycnantha]|nr:hypothetical protein K1719_023880 [Acacia pycnantha]